MNDPSEFRRGRHLLFAALALLTLALDSRAGWSSVELLGGSWPWDGADALLFYTIPLIPVALLAWLAFVVFDTHAQVELAGPRWWKVGWQTWLIFASVIAIYFIGPRIAPRELVLERIQSYSYYHDEWLGTQWGFLIAARLVGALTEEIVFRGLLQRALEGYMRDWYAIATQALIFHLVHVYVYGVSGAGGLHVITGIVYGLAFTRTRSLLAPVLFHLGGNLLLATSYLSMLD